RSMRAGFCVSSCGSLHDCAIETAADGVAARFRITGALSGTVRQLRETPMVAKSRLVSACALVLLLCPGAPSDDKTPDANAQAASKVLAALGKAYNARDAKAIGALFTPGAEFIDGEDNAFEGRDAIVKEFAALFENRPKEKDKDSVELTAEDVREISPGVLTV